MKVILKSDIKGVGKKDDVINVADGYARNYLFPRKLAVLATEGNLISLKEKNDAQRFKKQSEYGEARELAKKLSKLSVTFKVKTGENGRLFGSITSKDIAEKIKSEFGIEVDKKKIVLDEAIKSAGVYDLEVKVYPEVISKIKVEVIEG